MFKNTVKHKCLHTFRVKKTKLFKIFDLYQGILCVAFQSVCYIFTALFVEGLETERVIHETQHTNILLY